MSGNLIYDIVMHLFDTNHVRNNAGYHIEDHEGNLITHKRYEEHLKNLAYIRKRCFDSSPYVSNTSLNPKIWRH